MVEKLEQIIGEKTFVISSILMKNYKKINITNDEFIILIYLLNDDKFNPKKISEDLDLKMQEVLTIIDSLINKDIIKVELKKINNIREEFINFNGLYNKLVCLIVNTSEETKSSNIFDVFEREFGRTLSPMEYQIINGWLDDKMEEEVVIMALKEATYNGVSNLRYIDKILYEWRNKGLNTKEKIEKNKKNYNKQVEKKELFDYNWLDDNE